MIASPGSAGKLYSKEFQFQTLCALVQDPVFRLDFLMLLESSLFDFPYNIFILSLQQLVSEDLFNSSQFILEITNRLNQLGVENQREIILEAKRLFKESVDISYIRERIIRFLKEKEIKQFLPDLPRLMMEGKVETVLNKFEYIMSIGASKYNAVSLSDLDQVREELMKRYSSEILVSTGLPSLDNVFYGGFAPGEIHVVQAPPKSGKSAFGVNVGAINALIGKKVLHVTLELTHYEVLMRYIQRIANITYTEILKMSDDEWGTLKEKIYAQILKDHLFVLYYPEKSATTIDIQSWLIRQKVIKNWTPDFIIIDYDDCLLPTSGTKDNLYEDSGDIYSDLIKLAVKWQVPILTFSQPVRDAWTKPDKGEVIEPHDLAHSARKAHRSWSISSLNFRTGAEEGIFYLGFNRRGKSGVRIPLKRNLEVMYIGEIQ
jgi:hypothetical protein